MSAFASDHDSPSWESQAAAFISNQGAITPRVGIVLGTGLGGLAGEIEADAVFPYDQIPGFPRSTASGHKGDLVCGKFSGVPVVAMQGRFHLYEGYQLDEITLPIRVMHALGVRLLIVTNAAGGVNPSYRVGDIMAIADHVNLMHVTPRLSSGDHECTSQSPSGDRLYDSQLIERAEEIARRSNFACHRGVYIALSGPNYETRAEYRFVYQIGGDAVGMSTVPEVIVARQLGLRVLALSTITNVCRPDDLSETSGEEVVAAAAAAQEKLRAIVLGIVQDMNSPSPTDNEVGAEVQ